MTDATQAPPEAPPGPNASSRLPDIPGPGETLVLAWRRLRRMSTALILLLALAAATVVATFIPQEPVIPTTVEEWRVGTDALGQPVGPGPGVTEVFDRLGLFDVYGSVWMAVLVVALLVSLTGCLIPRIRAFITVARRPPSPGRNLARLSAHDEWVTDAAPEEARAAAVATLRRKRFRLAEVTGDQGQPQIAAERGHWREGGSLVFHLSFYVLLIGAVVGHTLGFEGQINVVEGRSFADTRVVYPRAEPGRFFDESDHRGFVVTLDRFEVDWFDDDQFTPRVFASDVRIDGADGEVSDRVSVNDPVSYDGMSLYQIRFGLSPRLVVHNNATESQLYDDFVFTSDAGGFAWTGVAPVATIDAGRQIAVELVVLPDADFNDAGMPISASPRPDNVRMAAIVWFGALGLERPVSPTQFLRERGEQVAVAILAPGDSAEILDGALTLDFPEWAWWSGFQVSHQPGRGLLLAGAVLILAGLVPSLYAYRRRLWVDIHPHEDGSRVVVAGVALQRQPTFADEHTAITDALRSRLPAATSARTTGP